LSLTPYSTELSPEPCLRRTVIATGLAASGIGLLLVAMLDIGALWRCLVSLAWICRSVRELWVIAGGYMRCKRIRIDSAGTVELLIGDVGWVPARLLAGSVVLDGIAWLRIESGNGRRYAELVRGDLHEDEAWRRLQVIWRHLGARP